MYAIFRTLTLYVLQSQSSASAEETADETTEDLALTAEDTALLRRVDAWLRPIVEKPKYALAF